MRNIVNWRVEYFVIFLSNNKQFTFTRVTDHFIVFTSGYELSYTKSADGSRFLVIGETIVESSAYLKRTGQPLKKISKSFKNILKRYGPLTLPCVVPLLTDFQCPKKL